MISHEGHKTINYINYSALAKTRRVGLLNNQCHPDCDTVTLSVILRIAFRLQQIIDEVELN